MVLHSHDRYATPLLTTGRPTRQPSVPPAAYDAAFAKGLSNGLPRSHEPQFLLPLSTKHSDLYGRRRTIVKKTETRGHFQNLSWDSPELPYCGSANSAVALTQRNSGEIHDVFSTIGSGTSSTFIVTETMMTKGSSSSKTSKVCSHLRLRTRRPYIRGFWKNPHRTKPPVFT